MRRIKELFVLGLPLGTKYLKLFWMLLILAALASGVSAEETGGGAGGP